MHPRRYTHSGRIAAAALTIGLLTAAGLTSPAQAAGHGYGHSKPQCRALHVTGTGQDLGGGATTATLYQGKRVAGESTGQLAVGAPDANGLLTFTGTIVLTTWKGTLEAEVEGTFDSVTGQFSARTSDVDGKGPLKNATGRLRVSGIQDLGTGEFTEVVHARVCVPKKKQH